MIPAKTYQLGEWLPDQPNLNNGIATLNNAIPQAQSYRSVKQLVPSTSALDSRALRAYVALDQTGTIFNFAGDAGKLYRLTGATYGDVSKVGGYAVESWEFTKFGDRVIAAALDEPLQYYDMGVSTTFDDLPGSPPKAKHVAVVRDFVVVGNLDDGGTQYQSRVQWSGFNNSELWGVDAAVQSDFQDLLGNGGEIQRIVPGEYGVIFQTNSIWRMDYAGPPTVFRFDEVERGRGTPAPNSVTWLGQMIYYWGNDGFYAFNGAASTPIGSEKVDRYVRTKLDTTRYSEFHAAIDRHNSLVMWTFPLKTGGNELIIYHWPTGRWGQADINVETLTEYASPGYSLDDLDTILADIDSASISVDSPDYRGGSVSLGAFDSNHTLGLFSGNDLDGVFETGEIMSGTGEKLYVHSVRPLVEGLGQYSAAIGSRNQQNQVVSFGAAKPVNRLGECRFHVNTRFPRVKLICVNGFNHATGFEVLFKKAGRG